jgi:outer membrane protein
LTGAGRARRAGATLLSIALALHAFAVEPPQAAAVDVAPNAVVAASGELTMIEAIDRALKQNYNLLADAKDVAIGQADVGIARSELLPHVDSGLRGTKIDSDRAEAAVGQMPEYQSFASVELRQSVYSDKAWSAYQVQRMLQVAREQDQEARVLDTILATAVAYLDLLRAEALLEVDRKNLKVTEANLQRATARVDLGVGTRSEIYRWETARANAKGVVVAAEAVAHQSRVALNRTMNEPLGNQYATETPSIEESYFMVSSPEIRAELAKPGSRVLLRRYFLDETLAGAPEIKAMQQRVDAQNRRVTTTQRAFYLPELSAQAGVDFSKLFPGAPGGVTDKTNWALGLEARLPLYQGGERSAERDRAQAEFDQEQLRYDDLILGLQSGVLQQTLSTEARFDQIGYARTAAEAGHSNLQLVTEAYERGVMTVTDLVDAQFAAFNADQNAANAVYDFLIDYLRLQRFTGHFDIVAAAQERADMQERLRQALSR